MRPVRIDVPDEQAGRSLVAALDPEFCGSCERHAAGWRVSVAPDRPFDRLVADLLPKLEGWLDAGSVERISVALEGRSYVMTRRTLAVSDPSGRS